MRKKKPIKLITLDTETYNGLIGNLKRIAIYDGKKVTYGYSFLDVETEILEYDKQGFDVHIYIHNLEFDARKIPELFQDNRIIWEKCFIINNKLATITTKHYIIHDSFKLLPMSLAKLSKDFGVEHGKMDLWKEVQETYPNEYTDIVDFLDRCDIDDEVYLKYLGYDVISLYEIIEILLDVSGVPLNQFVKKISTASLSRYIFKTGYKGKEFKNPFGNKTDYERLCTYKWHFDLETEEFIRCSYCGGRTEVFKPELIAGGFHYDVNSLYPYVMLREFPIGKPKMYSIPEVAQEMFENWMEEHNGLGFVSCSVFIPPQHIPPLPVKMGKLVFPTGHVYGTFTFHELEYAIKKCGVVVTEYREVCHFEHTYPIFKNFVETIYEIKEQGTTTGNEALRTFGKLLMNVGYGYTGMTRDKTKLEPITKLQEYLESGEDIVYINEELGYIEVPANVTSEYIQVQVASYVTSYARLILLDALRKADSLGEVYYCDTDSIVCSARLPEDMVDRVKLGMWDLEGTPLKGLFLKPKVYSEVHENKTTIKFKGISKDTQKNLSFDDYEMLLEELETQKNDYVLIEKNKLMMRSIMYLEKTGADLNSHEYRDKKMNIHTIEKRNMDYKNNVTCPLHFESETAFQNFSFNPKRIFNIDYL